MSLKVKELGWVVVGMTKFTKEELEEVGILSEQTETIGLILEDRNILVPIRRRDGEMWAGEFGWFGLGPDEVTVGVLCFEPPQQLDWVPRAEGEN